MQDCKRVSDRRQQNVDFRKYKVNNRKKLRRKIDKVNYSIYYIIVIILISIMTAWGFACFSLNLSVGI